MYSEDNRVGIGSGDCGRALEGRGGKRVGFWQGGMGLPPAGHLRRNGFA